MSVPQTKDLFDGVTDPNELGQKFEAYKASLDEATEKTVTGRAQFAGPLAEYSQTSGVGTAVDQLDASIATLEKSLSPEQVASLRVELDKAKAAMPDLGKDISLTSPISTGLVPYDLEGPSKKIFPVLTPLRNSIARVKGQGTSRRFKRIKAISGSGTGVGLLNPGIADNSTATFGGLTLQRPPKISYSGDEKNLPYVQMGVSDSVLWSAEFAGLGYEDMRQLSQSSMLYASMLADENVLAFGRGTQSGYSGTLSAPAAATVTARTAGTGETGNTGNIANYYVYITATTPFGESAPSTVLNSTALSATTGKVLDVAITPVVGALGYNVYAGTTSGVANVFFIGSTGFAGSTSGLGLAPLTINFAGGGTGGAVNTGAACPAADTGTAGTNNFDGMFSVCNSSSAGYRTMVNGKLSTTNPGTEYQTAFAAMYDANKANPDTVFFNGHDRAQLSEAIHGGSSSPPGYRITVDSNSGTDVTLGTMVTTLVNEVTGKSVELKVYPWMPQGNSAVISWSLPFPNTEVPNCWQYALVQDYMMVNWPVIQNTYDVSTYWYGALIPYAESFQGFVGGIQKAV